MITLTPLVFGAFVAVSALCVGFWLGYVCGWKGRVKFGKTDATRVPSRSSYQENNLAGDRYNARIAGENVRASGIEEKDYPENPSPLANPEPGDVMAEMKLAAEDIRQENRLNDQDDDPIPMHTASTPQHKAQSSNN